MSTDNCLLDDLVKDLGVQCLPPYTMPLHETRAFNVGWIVSNSTNDSSNGQPGPETAPVDDLVDVDYGSDDAENNSLSSSLSHSPWTYRTSAELGMAKYNGNLTTYRGGGYVVVLPRRADETTTKLQVIEQRY